MDITGKTDPVTGANRGLGRQLAAQLRDRGARVYAAVREPEAVDLAGVTIIALDITDPAAAARGVLAELSAGVAGVCRRSPDLPNQPGESMLREPA